MIEFTLQFEREKLELDVMVLQLSEDNYKDMMEEMAIVDWKRNLGGRAMARVSTGNSGGTAEINPKEEETYYGEDEATMTKLGIETRGRHQHHTRISGESGGRVEYKGHHEGEGEEAERSEDGLHASIIKEIAEEFVEELVVICQQSQVQQGPRELEN
eukprot:g43995.t1